LLENNSRNRNQGKQIKKEVKETSKYPILAKGTLIESQKARSATQPAQQGCSSRRRIEGRNNTVSFDEIPDSI